MGRSILVVEDEPLIALDVQECLQDEGAQVFCAQTLANAVLLADRPGLSAAVLDYELAGKVGHSVCDRLMKQSVPFLFYSGWDANELHDRWGNVRILSKPVLPQEIVSALRELLGNGAVFNAE